LAAFFSFGDSKAFFFASLLDFWDLDMVFAPDHVEETPEERWEAELNGRLPGRSISPARLDAVLRVEYKRVGAKKLDIRESCGDERV
jgi:hypothetical protein